MNKKAHRFLMISVILFIITLAITPVGGWCESNTWREYYMTAFCITGVMTLVSIGACLLHSDIDG